MGHRFYLGKHCVFFPTLKGGDTAIPASAFEDSRHMFLTLDEADADHN